MKCSIFLVCVLCATPARCQCLENVHSRIAAIKAGSKLGNWVIKRVVLHERIKSSKPAGYFDEVDFAGLLTVRGEVANNETMNSKGPIWTVYISASTMTKLPTLGSKKSICPAMFVNRNNGFAAAAAIYIRNGEFAHRALQPIFETSDPTATIMIRNLSEAFTGGYAPPALEADFVRVLRR